MGALFHDFLLYDTALLGAKLHDRDRLHLTIHTKEVIELLTGHITDANPSRVHFQRRSMITKDNPSQQDNEQHATRYIRNMLLLKTFLFL